MQRAIAAIAAVVALAFTMVPGGLSNANAAGPAVSCPITLPKGSDPVTLDPADFGGPIDNEYWPMAPGTTWVYKEGANQKVRVTVKQRTRMIEGIEATVVHDVVSEARQLVEDTLDWYAQDVCGNVWYLGEKTAEYENGQIVSTAGSWEAGVDGAYAGIAMPADPTVGTTYRQEYYAGEAEDAASVLSIRRTGRGALRPLPQRGPDEGLHAAASRDPGIQALREGCGAGVDPWGFRRLDPRGAGEVPHVERLATQRCSLDVGSLHGLGLSRPWRYPSMNATRSLHEAGQSSVPLTRKTAWKALRAPSRADR